MASKPPRAAVARRVELFGILSVLALAGCTGARPLTTSEDVRRALRSVAPRAVVLADVPVLRQRNRFTCGITSIAVVSSFLRRSERSPELLAATYGVPESSGMSLGRMLDLLRSELPGHDVECRANGSDAAFLADLHAQLLRGIPVPIMFGAPNPYDPPYHDFHFSIVYGLDADAQSVLVSNAYGYVEAIPVLELLRRASYRDASRYRPEHQRAIAAPLERNVHYVISPRRAP